jgi:hypothetical protein
MEVISDPQLGAIWHGGGDRWSAAGAEHLLIPVAKQILTYKQEESVTHFNRKKH